MLKVLYTHVRGTLLADIGSVLTLLPLDLATIALLDANVNFGAGEWTYLTLDNGVYSEEVKVIDISGSYAVVERGQSGSTPMAFSMMDTAVTDTIGTQAISDIIAQTPVVSDTTVTGAGLAIVEQTGDNYNVTVDAPSFEGIDGVEVLGSWPNIQFGLTIPPGGCCPGDTPVAGAGVDTLIIDSTILQGSIVGNVLNLSLAPITLTGTGGTAVTGTWPNFTIFSSTGGGGSGVSSVAVGPGLSLTGNPAVNPTIAIANTGVTAGDYSGFVINARGQITAIPVGFNPISSIVIPDGAVISRVGGVVTVTLDSADVGVRGLVALADESAPLDPLDVQTAVTPALLAAQLGGASGSDVAGSGTGEADATYTNALSATAINLTLAAGERAILMGEVQVLDGTSPLAPVAYGVAVFDASANKKYATKICTQSSQSILGMITGPFTGILHIQTSALPGGSTLQSAHLAAIKI
jgi:hypothetical protein